MWFTPTHQCYMIYRIRKTDTERKNPAKISPDSFIRQHKCLDTLGILAHFSGFGSWLPIESQDQEYISNKRKRGSMQGLAYLSMIFLTLCTVLGETSHNLAVSLTEIPLLSLFTTSGYLDSSWASVIAEPSGRPIRTPLSFASSRPLLRRLRCSFSLSPHQAPGQ